MMGTDCIRRDPFMSRQARSAFALDQIINATLDGNMKLLQNVLLTLILLSAPFYTLAAGIRSDKGVQTPNWYDVEIILFSNTNSGAGSLEMWPVNPGSPHWHRAVPVNVPGTGLPYSALAPAAFRLQKYWLAIQRSTAYKPLLHVAWTQPAINRNIAPFVRLGTPFSPVPRPGSPSGQEAVTGGPPVYGIARLSTTGPYLHFDLDVVFCGPPAAHLIAVTSPPITSTAAIAPNDLPRATTSVSAPCQPYRLAQGRQIEAGKLNYFDDPLFGALLLVTPRPSG